MTRPVDVVAATIEPTTYGKFFIRDESGRVWRGDAWVTFGPAELYPTYGKAMQARRFAIADVTGERA